MSCAPCRDSQASRPAMILRRSSGRGARAGATRGEGAAAALELSSRAAADTAWSGAAEVSVISARATVARRFAGGRSGVMLAARRSYIDLVASAWPYAFQDLTMRLDHALG